MRTFLINLDKDVDRLKAADDQFRSLGIGYERISGVYAKELSEDVLRKSVNHFRWNIAMDHPVRVGEIGCALSHYSIYRKMLDENIQLACIFEDDVVLDSRAAEMINYIQNCLDARDSWVVLLSNHSNRMFDNKGGLSVFAGLNDEFAEGYVITQLAAKRLLAANFPLQVPCDTWKRWVRRGLITLYHSVPTVCSQNRKDFNSAIAPTGVFDVSKFKWRRKVAHKLYRAITLPIDFALETVARVLFGKGRA